MKVGVSQFNIVVALVLLCGLSCAGTVSADEAAGDTASERGWVQSMVANAHQGRYVAPITSPFFNEPPENTTELRTIYLLNKIPDDFIAVAGFDTKGWINVVAVQARIAVTDRVGVILTKAGWADVDFSDFLPDDDGALNFTLGLKYQVLAQPENGTYLTVGGRYEAPAGDIESAQLKLQGGGDGFFDTFLSFGSTVGDKIGVETSVGINAAFDNDHDSSAFHASIHADYEVVRGLFGVLEANVLTTIDEGDRTDSSLLGSFEGYDLFNFGSTSSGTVATLGLGARYRMNDHFSVGTAYEFPITGREDIIDFRLTFDFILQL